MASQGENEGSTGPAVLPMQVPSTSPTRLLIAQRTKNPRAMAKLMRETVRAAAKTAVTDALQQIAIKPSEAAVLAETQSIEGPTHHPLDVSMDADVLIDATVSYIRGNQEAVAKAWEPYNAILAGILGYVYITSMALKDDPEALEALLDKTGVRPSKRGPKTKHHTLVTRALLVKTEWQPPEGTAEDYAKRVLALEVAGVPQDIEEVRRWLTETVMVKGKKVSGVRRARATLKGDRENGEGRQESDEREALEQYATEAVLNRAANDLLGIITPTEDAELPDGKWVPLVVGNRVLFRLPMTEKEIRKKVIKSGGWS